MSLLLPGGRVSVDRKWLSCKKTSICIWMVPFLQPGSGPLTNCSPPFLVIAEILGVWLLGRKETQPSVQKALNYYIKYIHVRGSCAFIYRNIKYCKTLGTSAISSHKGKEPKLTELFVSGSLFHYLGEFCPGGERELAECYFGSISSL